MSILASILVTAMLAVSAVVAYGASLRRRRLRGAAVFPATAAHRRGGRGASALMWVVISVILVAAIAIINNVVYNVSRDKSDQIVSCGSLNADTDGCAEQ